MLHILLILPVRGVLPLPLPEQAYSTATTIWLKANIYLFPFFSCCLSAQYFPVSMQTGMWDTRLFLLIDCYRTGFTRWTSNGPTNQHSSSIDTCWLQFYAQIEVNVYHSLIRQVRSSSQWLHKTVSYFWVGRHFLDSFCRKYSSFSYIALLLDYLFVVQLVKIVW